MGNMAYISQEEKKSLTPAIKAVLAKYGMKGTIGIHNHSTLVVNVASGPIEFDRDHIQVNTHWIDGYSDEANAFLTELVTAMKGDGWEDNSDSMTDYFDISYYVDINIGRWHKPYICTKKAEFV